MISLEKLCIDLSGFSIQDVDLSVEAGEFFALLGPTGSGKTLVLEAISGLVPITSGRIMVGHRDISHLPPEERKVGIVYQDHALFPHLTVLKNITYGLRYRKAEQRTSEENLQRILGLLNLNHLAHRSTHNLSGGEKQRVALARALAVNPSVLLLDEPLSSLDPNFREEIRKALKRLHQETAITFLMVTHDFSEALFLAQRAAIISSGRIEQIGTTAAIFRRPASPFVAEFVGMKNVFSATFEGRKAVIGDIVLELDATVSSSAKHLAVRPEDILIGKEKLHEAKNTFRGEIVGVSNNGLYYDVFVEAGGIVFQALLTKGFLVETELVEGTHVYLTLNRSAIHTF
jgi:molybdate/tungstate transport system ATP-binding protein